MPPSRLVWEYKSKALPSCKVLPMRLPFKDGLRPVYARHFPLSPKEQDFKQQD